VYVGGGGGHLGPPRGEPRNLAKTVTVE
jgi:hypothetical protein